ncbi:melanoma-associated antigen D4 isoform X1 [Pipistrellus kuhlii]|uniref:MAGE domain-containing protein n=1 Tax=Pipistrellus kuhlii TaxID=59472 RepID=A0A7J7QVZ8_PIPKU|nr:melanoma-associated antigen D4 isoform X1 [Pipistrellus kuhlii]XP_036292082.1 melanoma-associated antigen D4 isoform X1 [Pipistrellus kuhlii]KAF6268060.1 hypothetical protein mPipKuh1_008334 [Pipistrellus kuhlii]
MAEGSSPMEAECCSNNNNNNVEDIMEDGLEEVREYEMFDGIDGNDYEEFGAFGGYGTFTSFDIHLLRAFGSLGTSLRVLANEPWELDHPMLARTLVDAFRADTDPAPNEEDDQSGNGGRGDSARAARTAARAAARAAAAAARALYNQVVTSRLMTTGPASRENGQRSASSSRSSQGPGNGEMAPATSSGAPATSSQPQPAPQAREAASSRAAGASEGGATQPKKPFLGQNDGFDFTQPAGVSGLAFPRPKRPAPAPEPASEGPSAQAASAGEGAATRPKTAKSGKAVAKTRWVEPQNVVAAAAAKAKMATSAPEPEGAAATAQKNRDEARKGGKRTKKSKHLDYEYESSEDEREPPAVPATWRASQPIVRVRAQMAPRAQMGPRPPAAQRPQVPSRHVLSLPPRNVALLQDRANKLVKYLMIKDYKKIPIKRSDMMKDVIREFDEHFPEIIERATYTLEKKFGIHLKEIDKEEHLYILTCTRDSSARLLGKTKDTPRLSLLLVILGVIFMNGNRVSEAVLWEALRKMGLRPGVRHPFLGDLKKLITSDFVRQKYLEYKKVPNSSPPEYEFFWGLRARFETSKMRVLRFIAQYQNRDPRDWKAHFLEAVDDAFRTMDSDMAEEHARAQMRARMNIGDEALIGRWSWDDVQVELLTWDEDGDFGDAWARIPFAFWARYHQYILNSNRANRTTWRAGVSSGNLGAANASLIDGPSTSSTIRTRNAARTAANFFSWIQPR